MQHMLERTFSKSSFKKESLSDSGNATLNSPPPNSQTLATQSDNLSSSTSKKWKYQSLDLQDIFENSPMFIDKVRKSGDVSSLLSIMKPFRFMDGAIDT
jgi:hypothetical protein